MSLLNVVAIHVAFCGFAATVAMLSNLRQPPLPQGGSFPF
jgi:hypothetical protein